MAGAAIGTYAGSAVGAVLAATVVGAPIAPVAGVAVDLLVTSTISVGGSMLFDSAYDNVIKPFVENPKEYIDNAGNAVSGHFTDLGNIFQ